MIYKMSRAFLRTLAHLLFRIRVVGIDNIPAQGGVMLCSNHRSLWDPPLIGIFVPRQVHYMAKAELLRIPVLAYFLRKFGVIPVTRGNMSIDTIKISLRLLREQRVIAIFPEGTRSKTGALGEGKKGAASLALRSGATIIPTAIIGSYRRFHPLTIVYGSPLVLHPDETLHPAEQQAQWTRALMEAISRLLASEAPQ